MSVDEQSLRSILSEATTKCGMKNWRYKRGNLSETIENYGGFLIPITVTGVTENKEITLQVFAKLPSLDEVVRSFTDYWWDAEAYVYETLVPLWKSLSSVNVDELIPHCYYANATPKNQALVLKDMRSEGYYNYHERFFDLEHVIVSLKSLANFHAFSFVMKSKGIKFDEYFLRPYTHTYPCELNKALLSTFRTHARLFNGSKFERYFKDTLLNYETLVEESTSKAKCLIYGHGDYWKENIMFKYENGKPTKACILDFQVCRVLAPARDFLFFVLNSTNASLRRLHYQRFFTEYYSNLKSTLCDQGIELEKFYTEEDFISDLKIVAPLCVIHICLAFSLWLGFEPDSIIKSKNTWENDQEKEEGLLHLKQILENVLEDLLNYGYISL